MRTRALMMMLGACLISFTTAALATLAIVCASPDVVFRLRLAAAGMTQSAQLIWSPPERPEESPSPEPFQPWEPSDQAGQLERLDRGVRADWHDPSDNLEIAIGIIAGYEQIHEELMAQIIALERRAEAAESTVDTLVEQLVAGPVVLVKPAESEAEAATP